MNHHLVGLGFSSTGSQSNRFRLSWATRQLDSNPAASGCSRHRYASPNFLAKWESVFERFLGPLLVSLGCSMVSQMLNIFCRSSSSSNYNNKPLHLSLCSFSIGLPECSQKCMSISRFDDKHSAKCDLWIGIVTLKQGENSPPIQIEGHTLTVYRARKPLNFEIIF